MIFIRWARWTGNGDPHPSPHCLPPGQCTLLECPYRSEHFNAHLSNMLVLAPTLLCSSLHFTQYIAVGQWRCLQVSAHGEDAQTKMIQLWESQAAGSCDKHCTPTVGRIEVPQCYWTLCVLLVTPLISWSKSVLRKYMVLLWTVL